MANTPAKSITEFNSNYAKSRAKFDLDPANKKVINVGKAYKGETRFDSGFTYAKYNTPRPLAPSEKEG